MTDDTKLDNKQIADRIDQEVHKVYTAALNGSVDRDKVQEGLQAITDLAKKVRGDRDIKDSPDNTDENGKFAPNRDPNVAPATAAPAATPPPAYPQATDTQPHRPVDNPQGTS